MVIKPRYYLYPGCYKIDGAVYYIKGEGTIDCTFMGENIQMIIWDYYIIRGDNYNKKICETNVSKKAFEGFLTKEYLKQTRKGKIEKLLKKSINV